MHRFNLYRVCHRNSGFADRSNQWRARFFGQGDRRLHVRPALLAVEETLDLLGLVVLLLADGFIEVLEGRVEGFHERPAPADVEPGQASGRFSDPARTRIGSPKPQVCDALGLGGGRPHRVSCFRWMDSCSNSAGTGRSGSDPGRGTWWWPCPGAWIPWSCCTAWPACAGSFPGN